MALWSRRNSTRASSRFREEPNLAAIAAGLRACAKLLELVQLALRQWTPARAAS